MARKTVDEASGDSFGFFLARRVHAAYHAGQSKADAVDMISRDCARQAGVDYERISRIRRRVIRAEAWALVNMAYGPEHCGQDVKHPICGELS